MNSFAKLCTKAYQRPKLTGFLFFSLFVAGLFGFGSLQIMMNPYDDNRDGTSNVQQWIEASQQNFADDQGLILFFKRQNGDFLYSELCRIEAWAEGLSLQNKGIKSWLSPLAIRTATYKQDLLHFPKAGGFSCDQFHAESLPDNAWTSVWNLLKQTPWRSVLLGSAADEFALQFIFERDSQPSRKIESALVGKIHASANLLVAENPSFKEVHIGGPSSFQYQLDQTMLKDTVTNLFLLLALALLFRAFLGTWISSLLYLGTLIFTMVVCFGLMGFAGIPINVLSNSLVLMTAVAGVEDFLFVAFRLCRTERPGGEALGSFQQIQRNTFLQLARPSFWTSFTTAVGFFSLCFSPVLMIREFGAAAGLAAGIEWLVTFFLLPIILFHLLPKLEWVRLDKAWIQADRLPKLMRFNAYFAFGFGRWVRALALLGILFGIAGAGNLNFNDEPAKNFPEGHQQTKVYEHLKETRGWTGQMELLLPFSSESGEPSPLRVEEIARNAAAVPGIQLARSGEELVAFAKAQVPLEVQDLVEQRIRSSPAMDLFQAPSGMRRILLFTESDALLRLKTTVSELEKICVPPECALSGRSIRYLEISEQIVPTFIESFWVSILLVGLVIVFLARQTKVYREIPLLISAFWGPLVMIGLVSFFQIEMNLVTSLFAAVVVGLAGDNAIQYIFAAQDQNLQHGVTESGSASLVLAIVLVVCSFTFCLQTLVPIQSLGWLLISSFILNYIGDYYLLSQWLKADQVAELH